MTAPAKIVYPLERVLDIKKKRVEDAEKVVQEKRRLLQVEEDKLKKREAERDKVRDHRDSKLQQLRDTMDSETTCPEIVQMKVYLKLVAEKLIVEEKKVAEQKEQVEIAKKNLDMALHELKKRRTEVDKIVQHKKDWLVEMKKESEIIEGRELDEIGNVIHSLNQRAKRG